MMTLRSARLVIALAFLPLIVACSDPTGAGPNAQAQDCAPSAPQQVACG